MKEPGNEVELILCVSLKFSNCACGRSGGKDPSTKRSTCQYTGSYFEKLLRDFMLFFFGFDTHVTVRIILGSSPLNLLVDGWRETPALKHTVRTTRKREGEVFRG